MHEKKVLFAIAVSVIFLTGVSWHVANNFQESEGMFTTELNPVEKHGERITRRADGSIRTKINYHHGLKHGEASLYYDDGQTIQLKMQYAYGKRNGTSVKYYKSGDVYAKTEYVDDKLHGIRKTFYRNGKLKSEVPYLNGLPGVGLKEFYQSGKPKELPEITFYTSGRKLTLDLTLPCKDEAAFYLGDLVQDEFFNDTDKNLIKIPRSTSGYIIDTEMFTPSYLAMQDVICFCKSSQGNPLVLQKRILIE